MRIKDRIINEVERMTEDRLDAVLKFIMSLENGNAASNADDDMPWGILAIESGSFDFWLDSSEAEYTLNDLKEKK